MAFIQSQSIPSQIRVLALIAGGRRLRASELVLDEDKHYYCFDDDEQWAELVSARLVFSMKRRQLLDGDQYFSVTERGRRFLDHYDEIA